MKLEQPPARRFRRADGSPRPVGLTGYPVEHSLSPAFQDAAFAFHGLPQRYQKWKVAPAEFRAFLDDARRQDFLGLNVTLPHKEAAWQAAGRRSTAAELTGAVNTLRLDDDGGWTGHNTDAPGFMEALRESGFQPAGCQALVLGAGGAARGVLYALAEAGAAAVIIANRTPERARLLETEFARLFPAVSFQTVPLDSAEWSSLTLPRNLVINASSQALKQPDAPWPFEPASLAGQPPAQTLFYDLIYGDTPFLQAARQAGAPTLDGLPMLVYQGALAFEEWTGLPAPRPLMLAAARQAQAEAQALAARTRP